MMHTIIVGGGIAGLATAYYLQEQARTHGFAIEYSLVESQPRFGGKIVTEHLAGFVIEGGPDSMFAAKPWGLEICREIGLEDRLLETNEAARKVYVLWQGRLHELPEGILSLVPTRLRAFLSSSLISPLGKLRMGLETVIPPRRKNGDESLAGFVRRRLGEEALVKIAEPLLAGIYVADPERMSLKGTFPRLLEMEREHGSLIRGALAGLRRRGSSPAEGAPSSPFITLRGGMEDLVEGIVGRLDQGGLLAGRQVISLTRRGSGYEVELDGGTRLRGRSVVLTTPAFVSRDLIRPLDRGLSDALGAIPYVSTATVSLGYRRSQFSHPLDGFGFVVPKREGRAIRACTWSSSKFTDRAPQDHVLVRAFFGGADREEPVNLDEASLIRLAQEEIQDTLGWAGEPVLARVHRWVRGNPQYEVGHLERVQALEAACARHPGLFLAGSAYRGVGIPDCVRDGRRAAERVLTYLLSEDLHLSGFVHAPADIVRKAPES